MTETIPSYLQALRDGTLEENAATARQRLRSCTLCPRRCEVDRLAGETGFCKTGARAWVSSASPHFGEETPLVGTGGSGTIFFTHCNLLCLFCQNFDISHDGAGQPVSDETLAGTMLQLQRMGCHNINLVTPSHVVPQILAAVRVAASQGLTVPLVFNCGGYDRVETLRLLDGIVDIYMPDFKFLDAKIAAAACNAPDYPKVVQRALIEMHRQVGDLQIGADGLARRGLLVRHLVMPGAAADTARAMAFLARRISPETYVNVMPQYRPCGRAAEIEGLERALSPEEYQAAVETARKAGLRRLDPPRRVFMLR